MLLGYCRVSTIEQDAGFEGACCMEAWSGASTLRRYPSSDADEFGLPELAHSVERFDRDGNLCRASGVVA